MSTIDYALTGSAEDGIFGIPTALETSALVYIPVPWEVTTSYGGGAALGPDAILKASPQLDLFIREMAPHYQLGFHMDSVNEDVVRLNRELKPLAERVQAALEEQGSIYDDPALLEAQVRVNAGSEQLNALVYHRAEELDAQGKVIALIGGDHSSPLGLIRFLSEKYHGDLGVLHIDAHFDLREKYQGFSDSHASIMHNVMSLECAPEKLVQVGIRDFCAEEYERSQTDDRIDTFLDEDLKARLYLGQTFGQIADEICQALPENVYISFDIDGLKPEYCPGTGTPVPGGLDFEQAHFLIKRLVASGRKIIGFDLCEVAPAYPDLSDEWDGNVGARILFLLSSWMLESRS